jgi:hypothetical protein
MRKIFLTVLLLAMAAGIGACSKCDVPVWSYGACHGGPPASK